MNASDYLRAAAEAAKTRRAAMRTAAPQQPNTVDPERLNPCRMVVEGGQQCGCVGRYSECRCPPT